MNIDELKLAREYHELITPPLYCAVLFTKLHFDTFNSELPLSRNTPPNEALFELNDELKHVAKDCSNDITLPYVECCLSIIELIMFTFPLIE